VEFLWNNFLEALFLYVLYSQHPIDCVQCDGVHLEYLFFALLMKADMATAQISSLGLSRSAVVAMWLSQTQMLE